MAVKLEMMRPRWLRGGIGYILAGPLNPVILLIVFFQNRRGRLVGEPASSGGFDGGHLSYPGFEALQSPEYGLYLLLAICASVAMTYVCWRLRSGRHTPWKVRTDFAVGGLFVTAVVALFSAGLEVWGCSGGTCVSAGIGTFGLTFLIGTVIAFLIGSAAYLLFRMISLRENLTP